MTSVVSWFVGEWFGVTVDYILAGLVFVVGAFLAFGLEAAIASTPIPEAVKKIADALIAPLRFVGYALMALGLLKGAVAYGKSVGAADCIAASRVAELQQQVATLQRDLDAKAAAEAARKDELEQLAAQKREADGKVADYEDAVRKLSDTAAACRRASADDNRRLCDIVGNAAPGCQPAGKLRPGAGRLPGRQ